MRKMSFALTFVVTVIGSNHSNAQTFTLNQTLLNPAPDNFDQFGSSVAVSGDNLLVGVSFDFDNSQGAKDTDAAYLFNAATGSLQQTLTLPSVNASNQFNSSVAASVNNLLVGAPFDSSQAISSGAIYLFDAPTGTLREKLLNPFPGSGDEFGLSVAVSGNRVLVGAPFDNNHGVENAGAAYLFDGATGELLQTLANPSPSEEGFFGGSVAVSGNNALIGAPGNSNRGTEASGAAYLFDVSTGELRQTLLNPSPDSADFFGASVAVAGDNVLVGSPLDDNQEVEANGAVYLFDVSTGELRQTLLNPSPDSADFFGASVVVAGDNVLIGSPFDDNQGVEDSGAAFLYQAEVVPEPITVLGWLAASTFLSVTTLRQRRRS